MYVYILIMFCARHCDGCATSKGRIFLCNRGYIQYKGAMRTCFHIWHLCWDQGRAIPAEYGSFRRQRAKKDSNVYEI